MDDCSRYILSGDEFDAVTGENNIGIVEDVLNEYGGIRKLKTVITDRGSQYYANPRYKNATRAQTHQPKCLAESKSEHHQTSNTIPSYPSGMVFEATSCGSK